MRGIGKKDALACRVSLGLFAGLLGIASTAHGAPVHDGGGTNHDGVRAGSASITASGATTNITSTTANNVIGWKDFSVKSGETVKFDNGANTNNYLNIVTGNVTSRIDGMMQGGKNVYVANPQGVIVGDGASVDVGSLYVTTRKLDADAIGASVASGAIDLGTPSSSGVTDNVINAGAASSAGLAQADIVSLVDGSGSVKATKIVLEGKSVRILNDAKIDSPDVSAVADQSALKVEAGSTQTVRLHRGYVHVGYAAGFDPTSGSTGKYKNLTADNMYQLVSNKTDLDAITILGGLGKNYMLRNDIDYADATHASIGTNAAPFTGKFDGMFHEIKNMTVAAGTATDYAGLFGNTEGAEIMNVGIRDANLSTVDYGGAVVGKAGKGTHISAVYNEVTDIVPAATKTVGKAGAHAAGGIAGTLDGGTAESDVVTLDNAYNTAPIAEQAAGIAGSIQGTSRVYAVYNTGALQHSAARAVYKGLAGSSFIKDSYTTQGAQLGTADNLASAYDSYKIDANNKAVLANASKVTATPLSSATNNEDAKQASSYNKWDISDEGGANKTWRVFAGHSTPLLTAFMQGTVQAEYSYAEFNQAGGAHSGNTANTYTEKIANTTVANKGASVPGRTYDATFRKLVKSDGSEVSDVSDVTIIGYTAPAATSDPKEITLDADHGRRNAGKVAVLYAGQHGYDITGANIDIEKRSVTAGLGTDRPVEREYDGTTDMAAALKKAVTGITTNGLVEGDNVAIDMSGSTLTATTANADAGYGKALTVGGELKFTGSDAVNYKDIDATSGALTLPSGLTANIRQKTVVVKPDTTKDYNKTYDGTSALKSAVNPKDTNDVLLLSGMVTRPDPSGGTSTVTEDLKLNYDDITANYMTGKDASATTRKNAGTNIDIAYKNIKLADGTTGKANNYRLVDAAGNQLYRAALANEPTEMTKEENKGNERYIGAATTAGGTLWHTGNINKRRIDNTAFTVAQGADKVYDGTDYVVVNGVAKKVVAPDAVAGTDTNVVAADKNKISFTISAPDHKAYYINANGSRTKDVYEATNSPDGAVGLSYTLKAHGAAEDLSNYEIASLSGGGFDTLKENVDYTVKGAGKITPRTVYVDLLKKTDIDKEYDKSANVLDADKKFGTNFGYRAAAANANKLVKEDGAADDGAAITATAAVYKKKSGHTEQDDEVYRTGNVLTGAVEDNSKDVEYTIGLTGAHAATNYVLSYTPTGGSETTGSSVKMTGTGKITPKQLTLAAPGDVTRAYDQTSNVYAKQLKDAGYDTVAGALAGDTVKLALGADGDVVGTYYTDATKTTEAKNANARADGTKLPAQQKYTVKYTFTPTLDNGNYAIAGAVADGKGTIRQYKPTSEKFTMDFADVTKTFDGNTTVPQSATLSTLNITLENGTVVNFLADPNSYSTLGKEYADKHANTDRAGALLTGKDKLDVTYKIKLSGGGTGNYDLSGVGKDASGSASDYTVSGDVYNGIIVARTKKAGYIKPKEILATIIKPTVTKTYNRALDVLDENGKPTGGGGIINMPDLVGGNGSNLSSGAYDDWNVGTNKTVTYTLKVSDAYKDDYYFVGTNGGPSITTLTGKGIINPREIGVTFKDAVKEYDGTSAVNFDATNPAWGYTLAPLNGDTDKTTTAAILAQDAPTLNTAAGTTLKGIYADAQGAQQSDAGLYKGLVRYSGIKNALSNSNYTIADSQRGDGEIKKRQVSAGDFNFAFAGVTKVYDATKDVKNNGNAAQAAGYISDVSVNLGPGSRKDFTPGNGYTLVGASYADPNVAANQGTGNVTYTIKLDSGLLKNFSFDELNSSAGQTAGYKYDGAQNTITRTQGVGTITQRPVYALVNGNVSKTYNAKTDVVDGNGAVLTGDSLLTLGNKLANGTVMQDAGIVTIGSATYGKNVSTAKYVNKTAAEGTKTVEYTLKMDPTNAPNYAFYDGTGALVAPDASSGSYIISTATNTIKKAALAVRQDLSAPVLKSYDGGLAVEDGDGKLLLANGLTNETGTPDTVTLNPYPATAAADPYKLVYVSPNVTATEAAKKDNVKYTHLALTGADAGNYYLTDADGNALAADTAAGCFTMTGTGAITPLKVSNQNLVFTFNPITKTYDANAKVGGTDDAATWKSYISDVYIKKADGSKLLDLNNDIEKVNKAEYQAGAGSRAKDAGTGKKVLFNVKFTDEMLNNLEFDNAIYTPDADGNHMLRDKTYDRYTTGDITKKLLTATLDQLADLRKVYDGTTAADADNLKIAGAFERDSLTYGKTAVYSDANATINPGAASQNAVSISYTSTLGGTDAGNYAFDALGANTKTLQATGDIEKRKVYARVTNDPVTKKYDGTTDVKINGITPTNGDAYVTFGKSSNAAEAATTGMVTGYGTNDTTAAYLDANAGTNKQVNYTLAIGGDDGNGHAYKDNYVIYDAARPTNMAPTLSTYQNVIDKSALRLNAGYADKQYDGTKEVKGLATILTLTGAPTGIGLLAGYSGEYRYANVNEEGVDYSNVRLSGAGASNYTLSYNGNDLMPDAAGNYSFWGRGGITKRVIDGDAKLKVNFTGAPISKVYDGTANVTGDAARFVNSVVVEYEEGGATKQVAMTKGVDGAVYKDVSGRSGSGKNAGVEKDVAFSFTLDDKNFDLADLTGVTSKTEADGTTTRHYTRDYDRDAAGKALGEIKKRNVLLTVNPVEKIYDGTDAVRKGSYQGDGTENSNVFADLAETLVLKKAERNDDGTLKDDTGLVGSDGAVLDVANVNAHYVESAAGAADAQDANRTLGSRDRDNLGREIVKDVAYTVRLKGDATLDNPSDNYTFVDRYGTELATVDAVTGNKDRVLGKGDIYRKKLTVETTPQANKTYDTSAKVLDATAKDHLYLSGQENGEDVQFDATSFDTTGNSSAVRAYYGTKNENGVFTQNEHVNRDADGTVIDRDVQYRNLQPAFSDLKTRNAAAKNYFVQDGEVYNKGKIEPLAVTAGNVRRVWNGSSFSKTYDGTKDAKIGGLTMGELKTDGTSNAADFKNKLKLMLDLSTGGSVELDYTMYGEDKADAAALRPHYDDKNVKNSDGNTTDKDMVYTLKGLKSIKTILEESPNTNIDYDYSALATAFGDGTEVRLKGAGSETPDHTAAMITPRTLTVDKESAPYITKTYDGTADLSPEWTAAKIRGAIALTEYKTDASGARIVDEEKKAQVEKMLADSRVDFTVDTTGAQFLDKDGVTAKDAMASDEPAAMKKEGEAAANGKLVKYKLALTSTAANPEIEKANYKLDADMESKGDISKRMVHVVLDDTKAPEDKIYDGDAFVRSSADNNSVFKRRFRLEDAASGDTGVIAADLGKIQLTNPNVTGHFASKDVEYDKNYNIINKDVVYKDFALEGTTSGNASANYIVAEAKDGYRQKNAAKITPRKINLSLRNDAVTKEYDGTEKVKDNAAIADGKFLTDNIKQADPNAVYNGIYHTAAWDVEKAEYSDVNAGSGKNVKYDIKWKAGNYTFAGANLTAGASPDKEGVYRASIETNAGEITKRKVDVAAKDARKTYDATATVHDAWNKLEFKQRGDGEKNFVKKDNKEDDETALKAALKGAYAKSDPTAAYDDSKDAGENKKVEYTFDTNAAVMNNYEFANADGTAPVYGNVVTGKGTIDRRHLKVVSDSKLVTAGRGAANFTGRIEDGVNPGAATTPEIAREINDLNAGTFSYAPAGAVNYMTPGRYDIHGWYGSGANRAMARGIYDKNFILDEVPGTLAVAPVGTDGVDRTFRPDRDAYIHASYDESNTFDRSRDVDASLAYRDQGVNTGSASVVPAGTTGMGAQPGAVVQQGAGSSYRPGAQSGAVVQPSAGGNAALAGGLAGAGAQQGAAVQPSAGGNAALAGGLAGAGAQQGAGSGYRPGTQPGVATQPSAGGNAALAGGLAGAGAQQGAGSGYRPGTQSGAAAQSSAGGSAVDRGLAAAMGMDAGSGSSQSGARTGASGRQSAASNADGSYSAADRGLANALGQSSGAGYYNGKGYSHTDDDEEEEIKKKARASA